MRPILFFITVVIILSKNNYSFASSIKYYRSISSGLWQNPTIWQAADDINFTINVSNSSDFPDYNSHQILIRNGHTIIVDQPLSIDETTIEYGGKMIYGNYTNSILTIENGPGTDLVVNGAFEESGPFSTVWNNSSTWIMGISGTMIRTRSTSSTSWRDRYETGMKNIPASSNWIIRKQSIDNPSISAINTFYGNLFIENVTGNFWDATSVGSRFTGFGSSVVVKGNLTIGGNGPKGVKFYIENSNISPAKILGNMTILNTSVIHMDDASATTGATGIDLQGDLTVDGAVTYNSIDANASNRKIIFSGNTDQYLNGTGILNIYNAIINKPSGALILNRNITIDRSLILETGCLVLNSHGLIIPNSNPNAFQRINGWIKSETTDNQSEITWTIGSSYGNYIFPFGKNDSTYIPFSFEVLSGNAGHATASTYGTNANNLPLPYLPVLVTNIKNQPMDINSRIADRFWQINVTGNCLANLTFTYDDKEEPFDEANLFASGYDASDNSWKTPMGGQISDATDNYVTVKNVQSFAAWILDGNGVPLDLKNEHIQNSDVLVKEKLVENIDLIVYDLLGKVVSTKYMNTDAFDKKIFFNELNVAPGLYIIRTINKTSATAGTYYYSGF